MLPKHKLGSHLESQLNAWEMSADADFRDSTFPPREQNVQPTASCPAPAQRSPARARQCGKSSRKSASDGLGVVDECLQRHARSAKHSPRRQQALVERRVTPL